MELTHFIKQVIKDMIEEGLIKVKVIDEELVLYLDDDGDIDNDHDTDYDN
ncbi:MAG: hypothetical protein Unbinned834contig1000_14 [Prokaryotic dsDNA virus sp.]|nr:MAG: hypothetical protein Unbinned834contig1000_14 [Prokaryotic dsDNA virus sp.]|tara:strand:- start:13067 stop:13216 length:150 start_codon:yes stop_codon:yes gene_type:complete